MCMPTGPGFGGVTLTCNSEVLSPFVVWCTGLCALPSLAHATGETTAKPSWGVLIRSAGLLCPSTHEAKGGLGCDCVSGSWWCLYAFFSCGHKYNWIRCWQETWESSVFDLKQLEGTHILGTAVSGSVDSERQFTFQSCLKSLLPREEILEWIDKLKID